MISTVLVPMDDSEMAVRALRFALEAHQEATITVIHVVGEPSPMMAQVTELALDKDLSTAAEEQASDVFDLARDVADEFDREVKTTVKIGNPAKEIIEYASNVDVVVLGSHSGSIADRLFIGNVAQRVFRRSPVPVTTVR